MLNLSPRQALLELATRKARSNLTAFKTLVRPEYLRAKHLDLLDYYLGQVSLYAATLGDSGIGRLIIEMPPRHGKTLSVSRLFPAWHLGKQPDHRIIMVSYGASLALQNSRAARNIVRTKAYQRIFPGINLAQDSSAINAWALDGYNGGVDALGIGGAVTGKGANILIIDDPIKNRQEAESTHQRELLYTAFTDDLYTRLQPGGAVIVVNTRWHMADLTGFLLDNYPDEWTRLSLPAIAENNDLLGRKPGEALWPAYFPIEKLEEIKTTLGSYAFSSLYQQRPTAAEGGYIKRAWLPLIDGSNLGQPETSVRYWDLAMSEKESADYTVGLRLDYYKDGSFVVSDIQRFRLEWPEVVPRIAATIRSDGLGVSQGLEQQGYMSRAVQELRKAPELLPFSIKGYRVKEDKLTRALPAIARAEAGLIKVNKAPWNQDFIDELCAFPNGLNDDQLDAFSGAYNMLADRAALQVNYKSYGR